MLSRKKAFQCGHIVCACVQVLLEVTSPISFFSPHPMVAARGCLELPCFSRVSCCGKFLAFVFCRPELRVGDAWIEEGGWVGREGEGRREKGAGERGKETDRP